MLFEKIDKIDKYIKKTGISALLSRADTVIVGFSGGADSLALLYFFIDLRKKLPHLQIVAAHVNHMIRGEEAFRDQLFCEKFCLENNVVFEVARIDVPTLAKKEKKGLEECARDARYTFFMSLREKYKEALIATAHNADDNLETLFFNITRGSGTKGLSSISPIRDGIFIRPLLCLTGTEIRDSLKTEGIEFMVDSTNANTLYTRNNIRKNILPLIKEINPEAAAAGLRLSEAARRDCDFIEGEAKKILEEGELTKKKLSVLHPALLSRLIILLYKEKAGSASDLSEKNVSDCIALLNSTEGGSISLPSRLAFFVDKNEVYVAADSRFTILKEEQNSDPIPLFSDIPLDFFGFTVLVSDKDLYNEENIYNLSLHEAVDCDKINGELFVRTRLPGDTLKINGMNKKLKKLLCDTDIPKSVRDRLPIICDSNGILYVPLVGLRDGMNPAKSADKAINIYISKRR